MKFFSGSSKSWKVDHTYDDPVTPSKKYDDDSISTISGGSKLPAYADDPSLILETPLEKKKRLRSHWVAYATMCVMTIGFSVVLSGVWPYLHKMDKDKEKTALGFVVAANPLGQMIASPLAGYLGNRLGGIRWICYVTVVLYVFGNVIYAILPSFDGWWTDSIYHIMIFSRFCVGLSSSNVTLCRSYLASSTTVKERTAGIAMVSAAQSLGFVLGPAMQTILTLVIDDELSQYQAAGWFAALLGVINFVLLTPWIFQEYNIAEKEHTIMQSNSKQKNFVLPAVDYVALSAILFGFFMNMFNYVLLETLMEPFVADQYKWCDDLAVVIVGISFAGAGILALGMFVTSTKLAKIFDERKILLLCGFVPVTIGIFLFIPWGPDKLDPCRTEIIGGMYPLTDTLIPKNIQNTDVFMGMELFKTDDGKWCNSSIGAPCAGCPLEDQEWCEDYNKLPLAQFYVAFFFVMAGYPYGVAMSNAIFSKILGPIPQGFWMGILTACGSLARVLGPVFVSFVYTTQGPILTFAILLAGMILAVIVLVIFFKRTIPMKLIIEEDAERT